MNTRTTQTSFSFQKAGRIAVGANYWASHAAARMWRDWDAGAVEEDLRVLADSGIRLLRVFPNWADFQPIHACFLSGDNCRKIRETRMFDAAPALRDGWRVVCAITDDFDAAKWENGTLTLAPCAGILLMAEAAP